MTPNGLTTWAALAAAAAAFVFGYFDVMALLVSQWSGNDVYSYGFLIPVMSAFLIWTRRDGLMAAIGRPSPAIGVPVMLLALFTLHLGRVGSFGILAEVSLPLALAGAVLLTAGVRTLGVLWLPIAYLLFAVPIWDVFTDRLHEPFQLLSATIGQSVMRIAGVPSLRTGTLLQLPSVTLDVARACSGVNYLISVVVISIPYAYLTVSSNLRRAAVGVFAVTVAILSNGVRVALIGILQFYGWSDEADLHGPAHTLQGLFVAIVGYAALFIGARVLEDKPHQARTVSPDAGLSHVSGVAMAAVALVFCGAGIARPFASTVPATLQGAIVLPPTVGEWRAQVVDDLEAPIHWPAADTTVTRTYWSSAGGMRVYVGYLAVQAPGKKLVGHGSPTLPERTGTLSIRAGVGTEFDVAEAVQASASASASPTTTVYWYDVGGARTDSVLRVKALTVWYSLVRRQSSGALVVVQLLGGPSTTPEAARAAIKGFVGGLSAPLARSLSPGAARE
jgi:EpsI family protein